MRSPRRRQSEFQFVSFSFSFFLFLSKPTAFSLPTFSSSSEPPLSPPAARAIKEDGELRRPLREEERESGAIRVGDGAWARAAPPLLPPPTTTAEATGRTLEAPAETTTPTRAFRIRERCIMVVRSGRRRGRRRKGGRRRKAEVKRER